ncbi:unnamed protein product, partial [Anisakis simplex]|uniref:POR_N domain-containing protein n=1 Tax=Anisakis simplex TaxID=6269 RepID=A0A0M3JGQ2_ANISI
SPSTFPASFYLPKQCHLSTGFADALAASPSGVSPFLTGLTTTLASGAGSPAATNAAVLNATAAALRFPHVGVLNVSPVILVSNLDEQIRLFDPLIG